MIISDLKSTLFLGIVLMLAQPTESLQEYTPQKNRRIEATVGKNNLNRIAFDHDRIRQVYGGGEYDLEIDQEQGQIFIRPQQESPIHLSVVTEKGYTQDLTLRAKGMTPQTIIFKQEKEEGAHATEASSSPSRISTYKRGIKKLMRAMVEGQALDGFEKSPASCSVKGRPFPAGIEGSAEFIYKGQSIQGEIYQIHNKTNHDLPIIEEELSKSGDRAIHITKSVLAPGDKGQLFVIRNNRSGSIEEQAQS